MRPVKAAAFFAAGVTMLATAITGMASPAHAATAYRLYVSTHSNRSHAVPLSGRALHGSVYIFAEPASGALRVSFYLDNSRRKGAPTHTETSPPYDFQGGSATRPTSFPTSGLDNNKKHSLTIVVDLPNNKRVTSTATFTVHNVPPKPHLTSAVAGHEEVTVKWKSGGGITHGFYVYRSTHKSVPLTHPISQLLSARGKSHQYVDRTVKPGLRYYYVVVAVSTGHGKTRSSALRTRHTVQLSTLKVTLVGYGRDGKVQVDWKIVGTPTKLYVYRGSTRVLSCPGVKCVGETTKLNRTGSWTDTGITNGKSYAYRVEVVKGARLVKSTPYEVAPIATPDAPSAVGTGTGIDVRWTSPGSGVIKYQVLRGPTADIKDATSLKSLAPSVTFWSDVNAVPGTTYHYFVRAMSLHGNAVSDASSDATHVAAPAGLSTESGDATTTVHWTASAVGVTGYNVYRSTSSNPSVIVTNGNRIATNLGSTMGKNTDPNVSNGTKYYYVVQALTDGGSAQSAVISAIPIASPITDAPSIDDHGNVTLTWSASNDNTVTSYRIFRSASGSPATSGTPVATVSSNSHTWTDTNTNNGTTYSYIVQAWYSFSGGTLQGDAESNVVTATPDPPSAVQDLTGTPGFGAVDLNWDSVDPNAMDVVIYRSDTSGDLGDAIVTLNDTSVMTYVDPGPLSGTYYYTVRTESAGGYQDANVTVTVGP